MAVAAASALLAWTDGNDNTKLLNIVYIFVDDLWYGDVNLQLPSIKEFNNPNIKTPILARLAKKSLVMRHHYPSSRACSPSLAGLLLGRAPMGYNINRYISAVHKNADFFLPGSEITVAEIFKGKGYQMSIIGKWHLNGAD